MSRKWEKCIANNEEYYFSCFITMLINSQECLLLAGKAYPQKSVLSSSRESNMFYYFLLMDLCLPLSSFSFVVVVSAMETLEVEKLLESISD